MTQQSTPELDLELSRLDAQYKRRDSNDSLAQRYSHFTESALLHSQNLERNLLALLKRHTFTNLVEKKVLDVGCSSGNLLRRFLDYGALPANLAGIDLMAHRIEQARSLHPGIDWRVGSGHRLPYPDAAFDLVMSFVVFSSILSEPLSQKIADEMWRVRKPGALFFFTISRKLTRVTPRCAASPASGFSGFSSDPEQDLIFGGLYWLHVVTGWPLHWNSSRFSTRI